MASTSSDRYAQSYSNSHPYAASTVPSFRHRGDTDGASVSASHVSHGVRWRGSGDLWSRCAEWTAVGGTTGFRGRHESIGRTRRGDGFCYAPGVMFTTLPGRFLVPSFTVVATVCFQVAAISCARRALLEYLEDRYPVHERESIFLGMQSIAAAGRKGRPRVIKRFTTRGMIQEEGLPRANRLTFSRGLARVERPRVHCLWSNGV